MRNACSRARVDSSAVRGSCPNSRGKIRTMSFCLFVEYRNAPAFRIDDALRLRLAGMLGSTPGLSSAHLYTPEQASDPFLDDGAPPPLALQLYFASLPLLEAAAAGNGHLQSLADAAAFPEFAGAGATQQAMLVREFPVPDPAMRGSPHCTYLVAYEGPAEDPNAWHGFYLAHHPAIMATMPGVREVEVCTRVDWVSFLPWQRADHMQRNKVAFDSAQALTAALNSPVRKAMREDYGKFPAFSGKVTHFPMSTLVIRP